MQPPGPPDYALYGSRTVTRGLRRGCRCPCWGSANQARRVAEQSHGVPGACPHALRSREPRAVPRHGPAGPGVNSHTRVPADGAPAPSHAPAYGAPRHGAETSHWVRPVARPGRTTMAEGRAHERHRGRVSPPAPRRSGPRVPRGALEQQPALAVPKPLPRPGPRLPPAGTTVSACTRGSWHSGLLEERKQKTTPEGVCLGRQPAVRP